MASKVALKVKGIWVEKFGGTDVMKFQNIEVPAPHEGQVRVLIRACGLNFIDIYQRRGEYPVQLPYTPGLEASGVVDEVGAGVTGFKPGDRVAYTGQPGAYSQACNVKASSLIHLPAEMSFEQGASFPLQGMTAHYLINEYRKPTKGETVVIHAAAGGMGLLLVRWAKHLGARVIGTVSNEKKAEIAKEAGCDDVILYSTQDWVAETQNLTEGRGAELIIDGVGKTTFPGNLEAAALRGTIVIYGAASGPADPIAPNLLQRKSLTVAGGSLFNYLLNRDELEMRSRDVLEGLREGWLKLNISQVIPLEDAGMAHEALESRKSIGKIVLTTGE